MYGSFVGHLMDSVAELQKSGFFPKYKHVRNRPDLARKKEQARNDKCACGSEKKYKNCCGK